MSNRTGTMVCPVDQTNLVMSERQGIEIDYCPTCRGVWLDRGELDKIIERATAPGAGAVAAPAPQAAPQQPPQQQGYAPQPHQPPQPAHWQPQGHHHPVHYGDDYYKGHGYKYRKHWLHDLFD